MGTFLNRAVVRARVVLALPENPAPRLFNHLENAELSCRSTLYMEDSGPIIPKYSSREEAQPIQ